MKKTQRSKVEFVTAGAAGWEAVDPRVSYARVCRRWRNAAVTFVRPPALSGKITFPSPLKQVRTELRLIMCSHSYPSILFPLILAIRFSSNPFSRPGGLDASQD